MKPGLLLSVLLITFITGCRKGDELEVCRLIKFVQENTVSKSVHYDFITLKEGRMDRLFSFDLNINKDTLNKVVAYFEYDQLGKVKAVRDEVNPKKIRRFDADFDNKGNAVKITQTTDGNIEDEITIEYDARNRPVSITSRYLLGISRSIEYDAIGNPFSVSRSDLGSQPTITEHTFDNKRNFFSGIPEIRFYWIVRPHNSFLPFGDNNIVSSKVYVFQSSQFKESESQQTRRELVYNEKGFPDMIKIIRNDLSSTVSSISSFSYDCQ